MPNDKDRDMESWNRHQLLIMNALEEHSKKIETILETQGEIKTQIALLHLKSGLWGAVAGMIIPALYVLYEILKK